MIDEGEQIYTSIILFNDCTRDKKQWTQALLRLGPLSLFQRKTPAYLSQAYKQQDEKIIPQAGLVVKADSHFRTSKYDSVHCAKPSESPACKLQELKDRHLLLYLTKYTPPAQPGKGKDRYVLVDSSAAQTYSEQIQRHQLAADVVNG
jgi:hypothetical protein